MAAPSESSSLLRPAGEAEAGRLSRDWWFFSAVFSVQHGTMVASIAFSSSIVGKECAGLGSATMYAAFGLSAIFLATELVQRLGAKSVLIGGMAGISLYNACSLAAGLLQDAGNEGAESAMMVVGGLVGGLATGPLWTAQGSFFARMSEAYGGVASLPSKEATGLLAGRFALVYLGVEALIKLSCSAVTWNASVSFDADVLLLAMLVVFGLLATVLGCFIQPAPPSPAATAGAGAAGGGGGRMMAAVRLMANEPAIVLLSPINLNMGLMGALGSNVLNRALASEVLGTRSVGLLTSVSVAMAAAISLPLSSYFAGRKPLAMLLDAGVRQLWLILAAVLMHRLQSEDAQGVVQGESAAWWLILILLYSLIGVNRGLYESVSKALVADLFPGNEEAAFANGVLQQAAAGAFGFFVFSRTPALVGIGVCSVLSSLQMPAVLWAADMQGRLLAARALASDAATSSAKAA